MGVNTHVQEAVGDSSGVPIRPPCNGDLMVDDETKFDYARISQDGKRNAEISDGIGCGCGGFCAAGVLHERRGGSRDGWVVGMCAAVLSRGHASAVPRQPHYVGPQHGALPLSDAVVGRYFSPMASSTPVARRPSSALPCFSFSAFITNPLRVSPASTISAADARISSSVI